MSGGWEELADGVHQRSYESWNLNVGLVIGEERALVVDTRATPGEGRDLRDHVRELTDLDLVVVNSHAHRDHCSGNGAFPGTRMLAHPDAVASMRADGVAAGVPGETVSSSALVDLGGRSVSVGFHGRGHTGGDLVAEALGTGVVFAGDLVRGDRASWYGDAYPIEWPATLARMLLVHETATAWVPGHGPVMGRADLRQQAALLGEVAGMITQGWHAGAEPSDTAALLPLTPCNALHAAVRGYHELAVGRRVHTRAR